MLDIPSPEELDSRLAEIAAAHSVRPEWVRYVGAVYRKPDGKLLTKCRYEIWYHGDWCDSETLSRWLVHDGDFEA